MDASRFKRRTTQTQRTIQTKVAQTSDIQARPSEAVVSVRGNNSMRPVQPQTPKPLVANGTVQRGVVKPVVASLVQAPAPVAAPAPRRVAPVQQVAPIVAPTPVVRPQLPAMDMELPGDESPDRFLARFSSERWRKVRLVAFRSAAVSLVLVITLGGLLFSQSYLKLHKAFRGTTGTAAALKENVKPELLKGEGSGRINVLLLGRGGGTHDAPDLTDTIMLASIDPVNHTSTLVSVPRDLWVNVAGAGAMKLNAAWQTGEFKYLGKQAPGSNDPKAIQAGYDTVDKTIGDALGVDINYNVIVDFQAFQQAVDTVGGVAINVPTDLVDPTMAWENSNNPVLAKAGAQNFDGKHALIYARSRETTSDFARGERQRALMLALKTKIETLGTLSNPSKLSGLMSAFGNNVSTDLSIKDASRLYSITKQIPESGVTSIGLGDAATSYVTTGNMNGQSIVLPKAGIFNYTAIQQFIRSKLQDPYIKKENAKILVLNGTSVPGVASAKADELKAYGYNVVGTGNSTGNTWTQTTLVNLTHKNKYTKNYLEKRLGVSAADTLSDTSIATNGADFVIIIGSNEATPTQP